MIIVTKDYREYKCKLIDFNNNEVIITLWDDTEEIEPIENINYIKLS